MSENKNLDNVMTPADEMALMVEGLYQSVQSDLQKVKKEILTELKYSAQQNSSLYDTMQEDAAAASESAASKSADMIASEMKYVYRQNQAIYEDLSGILTDDVLTRVQAVEDKLAALEEIEKALKELAGKLETQDYDALSETVKDKVVESIPVYEELDYDKITDSVTEKTEAAFAEQNQQVLSAVASIPVAENIDYSRIVEEVGDRVLEILNEQKAVAEVETDEVEAVEEVEEETAEEVAPAQEIDYDKIAFGTAEKVVESLPYQEKVDYDRIERLIANRPATEPVNCETIAELVLAKMEKQQDYTYEVVIDGDNVDRIVEGITEGLDFETLSDKVAAKVVVPEIDPGINYDKLSDAVAEKITVPSIEIDYERLADLVVSKIAMPEPVVPVVEIDYEKLADMVAQRIVMPAVDVDYDALSEKTAEKIVVPTPEWTAEEEYSVLVDEDGVELLAEKVAEKLDLSNLKIEVLTTEPVEEAVEETAVVEEVVEEPVEEVVEEIVEEVVEEVAEEPAQEEVVEEPVVEETPAQEEVAVAVEEKTSELVSVDGLVDRLKKSFVAKMKQSEEPVKKFYSAIKNAFTSYKKVNSHISWHGDRFNLGRDTIAKLNIRGKTLLLYLDLDPNDEEFKQTVYHQTDVKSQKAYEDTPFMVKIKSDAALKKALRLVDALAERKGAEKDEKFEAVDYVEEFAYEDDKALIEAGLIRVTKEKKVALDF